MHRAFLPFKTILQRLARSWRRVQEIASSFRISVVVESIDISDASDLPAIIERMLAEDRSGISGLSALPVEQVPVVSGIFATILGTCQIRVIGPTGKQKVIDLHHYAFLPMWLYFMAQAGAWVNVNELLADVYGWTDKGELNCCPKMYGRMMTVGTGKRMKMDLHPDRVPPRRERPLSLTAVLESRARSVS